LQRFFDMGNIIKEVSGGDDEKQNQEKEKETCINFQQDGSKLQAQRRSNREPIPSFGPVPKNISSTEQFRQSFTPSRLFAGYSLGSPRDSSNSRYLKSSVSYDMSAANSLRRLEENSVLGTESVCFVKNSINPFPSSTLADTSDSTLYSQDSARRSYPVEEKVASPEHSTPSKEEHSAPPKEENSAPPKERDSLLMEGTRSTSDVLVTQVMISRDGKCVNTKPLEVRKRGKAVVVKPVARPEGNIQNGKQFYLQNAGGEWEKVIIQNWNSWNGTWQVKGEEGRAFPAAPLALKSEEEYGFLSRERSIKTRSFKSLAESSTV